MAAQVQPRLIALGIALALVGILALGLAARGLTTREASGDTGVPAHAGDGIPADQASPSHLTRVLPIVGGLSLALGAAFIGVGMNRWKRSAGR